MSDFGEENHLEGPFPPESAQAITGLLHLGYLEKLVSYGGHDFVLRTLKAGEEMSINFIVKDYDATVGFAKAYATAAVAASLELVDGVPLYTALGPNMVVPIEQKFQTVKQWFWPVVEFLYKEYQKLLNEQIAAFEAFSVKS